MTSSWRHSQSLDWEELKRVRECSRVEALRAVEISRLVYGKRGCSRRGLEGAKRLAELARSRIEVLESLGLIKWSREEGVIYIESLEV